MKHYIDMEHYPRKSHFEYFSSLAYPYVGLTANVDVTNALRFAKEKGGSSFLAVLYVAVQAANAVPQLRQRIEDGRIVEFDHCNIGYTVAMPDKYLLQLLHRMPHAHRRILCGCQKTAGRGKVASRVC